MSNQPAQKTKIQISSITCNSTSEAGHDEVYLICQADGGVPIRYPPHPSNYQSMSAGDQWTLSDPSLTLDFEYELLITLWDCDVSYDPTLATFLCCHQYVWNGDLLQPGAQQATPATNPNGASYTLHSQVVE